MMAVAGLGWLPRWFCRLFYGLLNFISPWGGKSFASDERGANHWFGLRGFAFGRYRIEERAGPDGRPSTWLNYDVDENPRLFRRIRGEVRALQPGVFLCRMLWKTSRGYPTVLWFTLSGGENNGNAND